MGLPSTWCVVCGCYFDNPYEDMVEREVASDIYNRDYTSDDFEWLENIRIFGLRASVPHFQYGKRRREGGISDTTQETPEFFDNIRYITGDATSFGSDEFGDLYTLGRDDNDDVLFAMHSACAEIVQRVAASKIRAPICSTTNKNKAKRWARWNPGRLDPPASLRAYYDALRAIVKARPQEFGLDRDHPGVEDYRGYDRWDFEDPNDIKPYIYDPLQIYPIDSSITQCLTPADKTPPPPSRLSHPSPPSTNLEALPTELLHQITNHIPTSSALNLRLCSKTLATRLPLDQRFFREALLNGMLTPFLWDKFPELGLRVQRDVPDGVDPGEYWDWRGVARMWGEAREVALGKPGDVYLHEGLWNRCRIWGLVEELM